MIVTEKNLLICLQKVSRYKYALSKYVNWHQIRISYNHKKGFLFMAKQIDISGIGHRLNTVSGLHEALTELIKRGHGDANVVIYHPIFFNEDRSLTTVENIRVAKDFGSDKKEAVLLEW